MNANKKIKPNLLDPIIEKKIVKTLNPQEEDYWGPTKNVFQHFYQKHTFYYGFVGNQLGQNNRNDRRIISRFHQNSDFDLCFTSESPDFTKPRFSFSLFKHVIPL